MRLCIPRIALIALVSVPLPRACADPIMYGGVEFPAGGASFADQVISYTSGVGVAAGMYDDPTTSLGIPEGNPSTGFVSLGYAGSLAVRFEDNYLTPSGDSRADLWIFEVGGLDPASVAISVNGTDWVYVGAVAGGTNGIDIDSRIGTGVLFGELYRYVRIVDLSTDPTPSTFITVGADIDAVGSTSSLSQPEPHDYNPVLEPSTLLLLGIGIMFLLSNKVWRLVMRSLIAPVVLALLIVGTVCPASADSTFFDDFNDGNANGWLFPYNTGQTQIPGGSWSVADGTLVQTFAGDSNAAVVNSLFLSDQVIEAQVRTERGYAGFVLWYQQVDSSWANYVAVTNVGWVQEFVDGHVTTYYYETRPWFQDTDWRFYDLRVEAVGATGSLRLSIDGHDVFTHIASTSYRTGLSGVYSGNAIGMFDDFEVTTVIPEPSSATLLFIGLVGLIGYGHRRKLG